MWQTLASDESVVTEQFGVHRLVVSPVSSNTCRPNLFRKQDNYPFCYEQVNTS